MTGTLLMSGEYFDPYRIGIKRRKAIIVEKIYNIKQITIKTFLDNFNS
jgi:hypothetical protein